MRNTDLTFVPSTFALHECPEDDSVPVVVAYGMTLPDGSVVAVGWSGGTGSGIALCRSAERAAFIYAADVAWLGRSA
jgi:hypothetical protein